MKGIGINKSFVMATLATSSSAAYAGYAVPVQSRDVDEQVVEQARTVLRERAPSRVLADNHESLVERIAIDGGALVLAPKGKLAYHDDSTGSRNCYNNCHGSCHGACHGSRGWR